MYLAVFFGEMYTQISSEFVIDLFVLLNFVSLYVLANYLTYALQILFFPVYNLYFHISNGVF